MGFGGGNIDINNPNSEDWILVLKIVGILFIIIAFAYGLSWIRKYFRYLRAFERYRIYQEGISYLEKCTVYILFGMCAIVSLWILSTILDVVMEYVWYPVAPYLSPILLLAITITLAGFFFKIIHPFMEYISGQLKVKPKKVINPQVIPYLEIFLKYTAFALGGVISIVIILSAFGMKEQVINGIVQFFVINAANIVFLLILLSIVFLIDKFVEAFLDDFKKRTTHINPQMIEMIKIGARYMIYIIAGMITIFTLLTMANLTQTGMVVVGITFIIVVLLVVISATSSIRNAFSGLVLMAFNPFSPGDRVKIANDTTCDIIDINIMFTRVRTIEGEIVDIPNNEIIQNKITNYTRAKYHVITLSLSVSYAHKHSVVEKLLKEAAAMTKNILVKPSPMIYTISIDGNTIRYEMMAYIKNPKRMKSIKSDLINNIQEVFHRENIEILT